MFVALLLGLALAGSAKTDKLEEVLAHRDELMQVLSEHDPDKHRRMERLEHSDPTAFALGLVRLARQVERLRNDPAALERYQELQAEEARVKALADGYHQLSGAEQKRRRAELEAAAERIMALKQAERRASVEELRAKIAEIEADIDAREKNKGELVDTFVDQLLMERVDL